MKKKKEKEEEGEKDEKYVKKKVKEATVIRVPDRRSWRATTKWPAKHGVRETDTHREQSRAGRTAELEDAPNLTKMQLPCKAIPERERERKKNENWWMVKCEHC